MFGFEVWEIHFYKIHEKNLKTKKTPNIFWHQWFTVPWLQVEIRRPFNLLISADLNKYTQINCIQLQWKTGCINNIVWNFLTHTFSFSSKLSSSFNPLTIWLSHYMTWPLLPLMFLISFFYIWLIIQVLYTYSSVCINVGFWFFLFVCLFLLLWHQRNKKTKCQVVKGFMSIFKLSAVSVIIANLCIG